MAKGELKPRLWRDWQLRLPGVPVLLYHRVAGRANSRIPFRARKYWIAPSRFAEHLRVIRQGGYRVLPLREAWKLSRSVAESQKVLVLAFDDGRASDFEGAFPILEKSGLTADFFINPSTIGQPGFMSWPQVRQMVRAGMSFHSHGQHHVALSTLPIDRLRAELADSKQELEARLGCRVTFLAAPFGLMKTHLLEVALEEGYQAVCSSRCWPAQPGAREIYRVPVLRSVSNDQLRRLLRKDPFIYLVKSARSVLLHLPKHILLQVRPGLVAANG